MNVLSNTWISNSRIIDNLIRAVVGKTINRSYATTLEDYKIHWVRPEKATCISPEKSGDRGIPVDIKPSQLCLDYEGCAELEDADEIVKKMFTVEFQPKRETSKVHYSIITDLVKNHKLDKCSKEAKIAGMSSNILRLQEYMEKHPRDKRTKVFLKELIEKRNKNLKELRMVDYKRFEWLLDKLNLVYKPQPPLTALPLTRKNALRQMTQDYCDKIVQERLDAYKVELKKQQKEFFKEKAEKLAFIREEELACKGESSVTLEEIEAARKKAEEVAREE